MERFTKRFFHAVVNHPDSLDTSASEPVVDNGIEKEQSQPAFWSKWYEAFKQIWPIYFVAHLAVLLIDCLSVLFRYTQPYQHIPTPPLSTLWKVWNIWPHDTPHFIEIAQYGYRSLWLTAFFPVYPFLIRIVSTILGNRPVIAALLISNVAGLIMLVVFYQLVKEEFDHIRAIRTVIYFSVFPSAFFFMAGYTETTFLCFAFLCFYQMRHGRWWLAGLFGLLAALTRNTGVFLLIPFAYEYLRQHQFRLKTLRIDSLSAALIPIGMGIFAVYCYKRFKDPLAFEHSQKIWHHVFLAPWIGVMWPIHMMIQTHHLLSFVVQRDGLELASTFFIMLLLILGFVGPWRFPRKYLHYIIFGAIVWIIPLFSPIAPSTGPFPYQSLTRYMLEVFPAFIVLATVGKYRMVHYTYMTIAGALFFFFLTQFLLGYMVM